MISKAQRMMRAWKPSRRAWRDTLPRFALRPAAMDRGRYTRFEAFLIEQGLVDTPRPVDSYAVELE